MKADYALSRPDLDAVLAILDETEVAHPGNVGPYRRMDPETGLWACWVDWNPSGLRGGVASSPVYFRSVADAEAFAARGHQPVFAPEAHSAELDMPLGGEALRETRGNLGLTQRQLAAALGVPWNTIARWERGELTIQHPEMLRLALERLEAISRRQP